MGVLGRTPFQSLDIQSRTLSAITVSVWDGEVEVNRTEVSAAKLVDMRIKPTLARFMATSPYIPQHPLAVKTEPARPGVWHESSGTLYVVIGRSDDERSYMVSP